MRDLLLAITGWVAAMESRRRSERSKAGMKRAHADGKAIGRPSGYVVTPPRRPRQPQRRYTRPAPEGANRTDAAGVTAHLADVASLNAIPAIEDRPLYERHRRRHRIASE